jgi:hypothetical protein
MNIISWDQSTFSLFIVSKHNILQTMWICHNSNLIKTAIRIKLKNSYSFGRNQRCLKFGKSNFHYTSTITLKKLRQIEISTSLLL